MTDVQTTSESPLVFSDSAAIKVRELIAEENNEALKLRVFISGGGIREHQGRFAEHPVSCRCRDRLFRGHRRRPIRHPQSQRRNHLRLRIVVYCLTGVSI